VLTPARFTNDTKDARTSCELLRIFDENENCGSCKDCSDRERIPKVKPSLGALEARRTTALPISLVSQRSTAQRRIPMAGLSINLDKADEEILTYEVSDEALESSGYGAKDTAAAMTLSFCSGLDTCPA
jgi:hypothetical protein